MLSNGSGHPPRDNIPFFLFTIDSRLPSLLQPAPVTKLTGELFLTLSSASSLPGSAHHRYLLLAPYPTHVQLMFPSAPASPSQMKNHRAPVTASKNGMMMLCVCWQRVLCHRKWRLGVSPFQYLIGLIFLASSSLCQVKRSG